MKQHGRGLWLAVMCCAALVWGGAPAMAQHDAEGLVKDAIGTEVAAQKENERWQAERSAMLEEMRHLDNETLWYTFQEKKYSGYVDELQTKIDRLERTRRELDRMEKELEPYLYELVETVTAFVKEDLPFLQEERSRRVAFLQSSLDDHELPLGEKLRRILEALEVEAAYGQSAEVTTETVDLDGTPSHVTVVRAGRLGLYCLTPDGETAGRYNEEQGRYVTLPGAYVRSVAHLRDMVKQKRFTELVALPVKEVE